MIANEEGSYAYVQSLSSLCPISGGNRISTLQEGKPSTYSPSQARQRKKMGDAEIEDVVLLYSRGGVTMQDLADKHGASLSYVSRIINGSRLAHRHTRTKLGKEGYEDKLNSV